MYDIIVYPQCFYNLSCRWTHEKKEVNFPPKRKCFHLFLSVQLSRKLVFRSFDCGCFAPKALGYL